MSKLTIDFVGDLIKRFGNKEMTIGKVTELLNEESDRNPTREEAGIFGRDECVFVYCPNPELCKEKCINP